MQAPLVQASPVLNLFSVVTFVRSVMLNDLWRESFYCGRLSDVPAVAVVGHLWCFVPLELLLADKEKSGFVVLCSRIADSSFRFDPV